LIQSGTLRQLKSGHSHEDVDQVFGSLALWIVRHARHIETPGEFADAINKFCIAAHRPHEKERAVIVMDQHRDWSHGFL